MKARLHGVALPVVAWASLAFAAAALAWLTAYKETPGESEPAPEHWPAASTIPRDAMRPTLVVFAHPMCTCTRATLSELRTILSAANGRLSTVVALLTPSSSVERWDASPSAALARSIPGVRLVSDVDGREAHRFGARTSGHVVMYAPSGTVMFAGGITPIRGHVGDNAGRARILALTLGGAGHAPPTPTFGCPLDDPDGGRGAR